MFVRVAAYLEQCDKPQRFTIVTSSYGRCVAIYEPSQT